MQWNVVVLINGKYGLALDYLYTSGWSPICRCGCWEYPAKKLESVEEEYGITILFEDSERIEECGFKVERPYSNEEIKSLLLSSKSN